MHFSSSSFLIIRLHRFLLICRARLALDGLSLIYVQFSDDESGKLCNEERMMRTGRCATVGNVKKKKNELIGSKKYAEG